jgi:hypothetical protein
LILNIFQEKQIQQAADALSRYPYDKVIGAVEMLEILEESAINKHIRFNDDELMVNSVTVTTFPLSEVLKGAIISGYKTDATYKQIYNILKEKLDVPPTLNHSIKHYEYRNDLLYYKTLLEGACTRVVTPMAHNLPVRLIRNAHSGNDAGHFGPWC